LDSRERFLQIVRFERTNDPYMWSIAAWNKTYRRWKIEGMPVNINIKEINEYLLGMQDQIESVQPNAAGLGLGENGNPPWVPPLDPFFEPKILEEDKEHITRFDYDGSVVKLRKDDYTASMPAF